MTLLEEVEALAVRVAADEVLIIRTRGGGGRFAHEVSECLAQIGLQGRALVIDVEDAADVEFAVVKKDDAPSGSKTSASSGSPPGPPPGKPST